MVARRWWAPETNSGYQLSWPGQPGLRHHVRRPGRNYANGVRTQGGDTVSAIYTGGADATNGLYETGVSVTVPESATTAAQVTAFMTSQAANEYAALHAVRPSYTLVVRPQGWMYGDSDVGDTVTVKVPTFESVTSDTQRVLTQVYTIGDDGNETIGVTLGNPPIFSARAQAIRDAKQSARLLRLEQSVYSNGTH